MQTCLNLQPFFVGCGISKSFLPEHAEISPKYFAATTYLATSKDPLINLGPLSVLAPLLASFPA